MPDAGGLAEPGRAAGSAEGLCWSYELDLAGLLAAIGGVQAGDPADQEASLAEERAAAEAGDSAPRDLTGVIADQLPAGPGLAGWLANARPDDLTDWDLPGIAAAYRRVASWAQAGELAAVAVIASRAAARDDKVGVDDDGRPARVTRAAANEVSLALAMSQVGASWWSDLAVAVRWRLPATGAALAAGAIDLSRARLIAEATAPLDDEDARAVEDLVLPTAGGQTTGQLRAALRRAVLRVDPHGAEERRQNAERHAKVSLYTDEVGTAALVGARLPGVHAAAAMARISALAQAMKAAGSGGGIDLLRAQVFIGLLLGTLPLIPAGPGGPPDSPPDLDDPPSAPGPGPGPGDPAGSGSAPGNTRPGDASPDPGGLTVPWPGRGGRQGPVGRRSASPGSDPAGGARTGQRRPPGPAGDEPPPAEPRGTLDGSTSDPPHSGSPGSGASGSGASGSGLPDAGPGGAGEGDSSTGGAGVPRAGPPGARLGDGGQPDSGQPDGGQPDGGQPDGQPDGGQPDGGQPDDDVPPVSDADAPKRDDAYSAGPPDPAYWRDDHDDGDDGVLAAWPPLPATIADVPPVLGGPPRSYPVKVSPPPGTSDDRGDGGTRRPSPGLLDLTISWRVLTGEAAAPARLGRLGPISAAEALPLACLAVADPAAQWRVILTDSAGHAIGVERVRRGRLCANPGRVIGVTGRVTVTVPAATLSNDPAGQPGPRSGTDWPAGPGGTSGTSGTGRGIRAAVLRAARRAAARAEKAAVADTAADGCAHTTATAGYRPTTRIREYVEARDQTCRQPYCGQPAWRADLDHTIPWHKGGATCPCNLGGRCRTHHQIKQEPGWTLTQPRPGHFQWTTPAGRTYITEPDIYPA